MIISMLFRTNIVAESSRVCRKDFQAGKSSVVLVQSRFGEDWRSTAAAAYQPGAT